MIGLPSLALALCVSALSLSCNSDREPAFRPTGTAPDTTVIPYDFEHPDAAFALPAELLEISGLTVVDSTRLAAVQDERGVVFFLDRESALIVGETRFRGNGDYEGIEWADSLLWVLRSDGSLYSMDLAVADEVDSDRHDLDLHGSCDAEGLALEGIRNRLLVACKENPGRRLGPSRAIYAFDLSTERRIEDPVYLIDRQGLEARNNRFKPSALAIHPGTGFLYILSSVHKILVVIDPHDPERILEARELPVELFAQPEGIAFFPDGTLFISNEGVNGPATLLRFDKQMTNQ